jgi:hypothetical protein
VSPVRYELGFCIPEDDILRSHSHKSVRVLSRRSQSVGTDLQYSSRILLCELQFGT